jgi:hypothetical protein
LQIRAAPPRLGDHTALIVCQQTHGLGAARIDTEHMKHEWVIEL